MWKPPTVRFSIRGLLILTAAVAGTLGLARWLGGMVFVPLAPILFSIVIEYIFCQASDSRPRRSALANVGHHLAVLAGAGITTFAAWLGVSEGAAMPTLPLPLLTALPLFYGAPEIVSLVIPSVAFLTLMLYPARSARPCSLPLRFPVLLGVVTALSIAWFVLGVQYSYGFHGPRYTIGITIINAAMILGLWITWRLIHRRAVWWTTLVWPLAVCCWLFGLAFPWLGEYP